MRFRTKDLQEFFNKKIDWKKVAQELTEKSFETLYEDGYLDVDILPNRFSDAGNIYGLAKEISLITGYKIKDEKFKIKEISKKIENFIKISSRTHLCLNYFARVILDVKNSESPNWLKEFVESYGLNSINLIVDLSNYVMIKYGAPLHVFDLDKVEKEIIVRESKEKEVFHSLKDVYYTLPKGCILITDKKKILALAGIQGAKSAEVDLNTKNILIEAAIFDPSTIYKTSRALNLQTEASYRFERKVSEINSLKSLEYLTYLIQKYCKGKPAKGIFQLNKIQKPDNILLKFEKLNNYVGEKISDKEITNLLKRLGAKIMKKSKDYVYITPPIERLDLKTDVDLIEEIARFIGYKKVKESFPSVFKIGKENKVLKFEDFLRKNLTSAGLDEVITYSFIDDEDLVSFEEIIRQRGEIIEILNPVSNLFKYYRPFVFINLVKAISKNLNYYNWLRTKEIEIFEIGDVAVIQKNKIMEDIHLGIAITRENLQNLLALGKGILNYLAEILGLKKFHYKPFTQNTNSFKLLSAIHTEEEDFIGFWGYLSEDIMKKYEIKQPVFVAEINLTKLINYFEKEKLFKEIPTYPAIIRDLSLIVAEYIQSDQIENEIYEVAKDLLEDIELFDIYQGPPLKENEKSLAYHLIFRRSDRTLKDEEVDILMSQIIKRLQDKFGAIIR